MNEPSSTGQPRRRIATTYLLWIVSAITVAFLLFGAFVFYQARNQELEQNEEMARLITEKTNQALQQWISEQIRISQTIAADDRVRELCHRPLDPGVRAAAQEYLSGMYKRYSFYENIPVAVNLPDSAVLTVDSGVESKKVGRGHFVIDTVMGKTIGKCGPQFSYIQKTFDEGFDYFISEVYPSILRGNPIFVVCAPVKEGGKVLGSVIVAPRMDYFTEFFVDDARFGTTGYLIMLDERGMIISHPRKDLILNAEASKSLDPIMENIRAGRDHFVDNFEGTRKVYTVARFSSEQFHVLHGWYIVSCRDFDDIVAPARSLFYKIVACIVLIALFLIVLIAMLTTRLITRPLGRLTVAAHRVADGDLSATLEIDNRDNEITALTRAVVHMTASLREQTRSIRESVQLLEGSAGGIGESSRQQERMLQAHKESTAGMAASVEEISATSRALAATMQQVRDTAATTAEAAGAGQSRLALLQETVRDLGRATGAITEQLAMIKEKADHIGGVVTAIGKVADQTNLLSLNAAIEAEKAGEYGRGFAVVAREIRRLADQTAISTSDITRIVQEMQGAVATGSVVVEGYAGEVRQGIQVAAEAGQEIARVIERVRDLAPRFDAVNDGMHAQSLGASEINSGMQRMNEGTEETVTSLNKLKEAATQLRGAATDLAKLVERFRS